MKNRKSSGIGILLIVSSSVFLAVYTWLIFFSKWNFFVLQVSCFVIVTIGVGLIIWIGKTLILAKRVGEEMEN